MEKQVRVDVSWGEIPGIGHGGAIIKSRFDTGNLTQAWYRSMYAPDIIDHLLKEGFGTDDIEEMLYCGEL